MNPLSLKAPPCTFTCALEVLDCDPPALAIARLMLSPMLDPGPTSTRYVSFTSAFAASVPTWVIGALTLAVEVNRLLAFFNLIPVPPLDGGNVMLGLLPPRAAAMYVNLRRYGFLILYALFLSGIASALIMPPMLFFARILLP